MSFFFNFCIVLIRKMWGGDCLLKHVSMSSLPSTTIHMISSKSPPPFLCSDTHSSQLLSCEFLCTHLWLKRFLSLLSLWNHLTSFSDDFYYFGLFFCSAVLIQVLTMQPKLASNSPFSHLGLLAPWIMRCITMPASLSNGKETIQIF